MTEAKLDLAKLPLIELAKMYIDVMKKMRKNIKVIENAELLSTNGRKKYRFDFIIEDPAAGDLIGVIVKDWARTLGVNVVYQFIRKIRETGLTMGILIGTEFSAIVRKREFENIFLISRGELVSYLKSLNYSEQAEKE